MPDVVGTARARLDAWSSDTGRNSFDDDDLLHSILRRTLGAERFEAVAGRLREIADAAGPELDALVRETNRDENLPRLRGPDAFGRATEEVQFHPAHHAVGRVFWASRVLSVLAEPGTEVLAGAIAYLLDQHGEAGHACPVACTAGAIKLIQRLGDDDQRRRYLPRLLDPDYERRLHAAQFVTEIQGGSDVGLNACVARPDEDRPGRWRISGEKWFCSVADAGLFVLTARVDGAPPGTRGLGLFLVPRTIDGQPNGFTLRRLKDKLGTRSLPTGEIELSDALAEPIGPLEDGFRNLVGIVLDTSRVHNGLAACGIMRRAWVEASAYARHRVAFDHPIAELPAVQEILARMRLRTALGLLATFRVLALTDRVAGGAGDSELVAARRIAVMVNKYRTAVAATESARDGIEVLGGNGAIEEFSVLPRLYRDAIVVESWEGTHNTLAAQVMRDFAVRSLHRPWLALLEREAAELPAASREQARELLADVGARIGRAVEGGAEAAAVAMRSVVDRMCRLTEWVTLAAHAGWEAEKGIDSGAGDLLELYRLREVEGVEPQDEPVLVALHRRLAAGSGSAVRQ
mgnify:FL=1